MVAVVSELLVPGTNYFLQGKYDVSFTGEVTGQYWHKARFEVTWDARTARGQDPKYVSYDMIELGFLTGRVWASMLLANKKKKPERFQALSLKHGELLRAVGALWGTTPSPS